MQTVFIEGRKIIVEGDFVSIGLDMGLEGNDLLDFEHYNIYLEAYRQMYNYHLELGNEKEVEYYGDLMRNCLKNINNLKG